MWEKPYEGPRVGGQAWMQGVAFSMGCLKMRLKTEEAVHVVKRCWAWGPGPQTEQGQVSCNCSQNLETPKWLPLDELLGTVCAL